jgi:putative endonuclease
MTSDPRHVLGFDGEEAAALELERRGTTSWRAGIARLGELDIVARDGGDLVFVEVKTRSTPAFGDGLEAITADKRRRLVRMAHEYLWINGLADEACRFDVVAIDVRGLGRQRRLVADVIAGAFEEGE